MAQQDREFDRERKAARAAKQRRREQLLGGSGYSARDKRILENLRQDVTNFRAALRNRPGGR